MGRSGGAFESRQPLARHCDVMQPLNLDTADEFLFWIKNITQVRWMYSLTFTEVKINKSAGSLLIDFKAELFT